MKLLKTIRILVAFPFAFIGARMWQSAFDRGVEENYDDLTLKEKIGYRIYEFMLNKVGGITIEEMEEIAETIYSV